ncbi:MAG TPA: TonB-dependent receptor [Gemmatimonadaceae bacterium]|nr:TonB-dependent receptor [Gemmatimonadaceae bacterium]
MLRWSTWAVVLLTALTTTLRAQSARIEGRVSDHENRRPVADAFVAALSQPNARGRSDAGGRFASRVELPVTLIVGRLGFVPETLQVATASEAIRVTLRAATITLTPTVIRAEQAQSAAASRAVRSVDIALRSRASSQELLRLAPGLVIAQHAGGGKAEQIFLRGFDADHGTDVAIFVDGVPINLVSHGHGQGYADLHFVIPEIVNRVDVRKGPYDTRDGDLAVAGAVNFVTRERVDARSIAMRVGSFNTFDLTTLVPFGGDASHAGGYVAGSVASSDGPFIASQDFRRWNAYAKYTAPLGVVRVGLTLSGFGARWDASGQVPERAVKSGLISRFGAIDSTEGGTTSRYDVVAMMTGQTSGSGTTWGARAFATRYEFRLFSNFTFFLDDSLNGDGIEQRDDRVLAGAALWVDRLTPLFGNVGTWRGTVGGRVDDATVGLFAAPARTRVATRTDDRVRVQNIYATLDRSVTIGKLARVTLGVRADGFRFDVDDRAGSAEYKRVSYSRISPKGSLALEVSPSLSLFANAGAGFHSNDARAVVRAPSAGESLPRALGYEIGARRRWDGGTLAAALWGLDLTSELVWSGDAGTTESSGRSRRTGVDLEGRVRLASWLWGDADVNLARGRLRDEPQGADRIPLAPTITTAGGLRTTEARGIAAGIRWRHIGARAANADNSVRAHRSALLETVSTLRWRGSTIRLAVDNVLNVRWNEAQFATTSRLRGEAAPVTELHYTPGAPRTLTLGMEKKF